ncbi:hypothetical protein TEA_014972 [Camellia sinensis var. sinensis]|uniref:Uncharacterized protein n=1 Tax=Camellia sinensis var. sinensis TaxID=542762 RepID=A0A4S4DN05_CAMSN|nr:hypothetical protein TEA_014972 [Camellia sinensis var. sinensis]
MPCHGLGKQHAMPRPWQACHASALASSMPCLVLAHQDAMPQPWPAACHAPCPSLGQQHDMPAAGQAKALASSIPCQLLALGQHHAMPMPWPTAYLATALSSSMACHATALASSMACLATALAISMPCHGLDQQHGMPCPWLTVYHDTALASMPCPSVEACCEKYVPQKLPVGFVICIRVGRIPACVVNSTGVFLHVPRVIAFRLSSTRLQASCPCFPSGRCLGKSVSLGANRCLLSLSKCFRVFVGLLSPAGCDSFRAAANSTGAFLFIIREIPIVACALLVDAPCENLCPSVGGHLVGFDLPTSKLPALPQWKLPCEKHVPRVIAILLALTCERVVYAFQVEACCKKYVLRKFCILPLLLAVALTGACLASLNVLARSSDFLVLRGVIRFGRLVRSVRRGALPALSLVENVLAKSYVPRLVAVRFALTCLRVACALLVEAPCENVCPLVGSHPVGFDMPTSYYANRCLLGFSKCSRSSGFLVVQGVIRFGRELLWCIPLRLCFGAKSCLLPCVGSCVAYLKKRNSVRIMCLYSSHHLVALGEPRSTSRVPCCPLTLSCWWHSPRAVMLMLSDSEPCAGTRGLRPPFSRQALVARCGLLPRLPLTVPALSVGLMHWILGWVDRSASGVPRSSRPFCRRCTPGLNWPGRASGAVTLKKLECSKQAYTLDTLAWDNII